MPTILSRCVTLQTRAVEEKQIADFLRGKKGLSERQAEILRQVIGTAAKSYLLADHTKIDRTGLYRFASRSAFSDVITD